jgi:hypothetical protein
MAGCNRCNRAQTRKSYQEISGFFIEMSDDQRSNAGSPITGRIDQAQPGASDFGRQGFCRHGPERARPTVCARAAEREERKTDQQRVRDGDNSKQDTASSEHH